MQPPGAHACLEREDHPALTHTSHRSSRQLKWPALDAELGFRHPPISAPSAPRPCVRQGFPDIWWFIWDELPVGVSAAENMRFPVMGDIMLSQQTIFVDREARESGQSAADKILQARRPPGSIDVRLCPPRPRQSTPWHSSGLPMWIDGQNLAFRHKNHCLCTGGEERQIPQGGHLPGGKHVQRAPGGRVQARRIPAGAAASPSATPPGTPGWEAGAGWGSGGWKMVVLRGPQRRVRDACTGGEPCLPPHAGAAACVCVLLRRWQGVPVQPVVIRYPNKFLDVSWVEPLGLPVHSVAIRMMLQASRRWNFKRPVSLQPPLPQLSSPAARCWCCIGDS